jgi:hypothetical protein
MERNGFIGSGAPARAVAKASRPTGTRAALGRPRLTVALGTSAYISNDYACFLIRQSVCARAEAPWASDRGRLSSRPSAGSRSLSGIEYCLQAPYNSARFALSPLICQTCCNAASTGEVGVTNGFNRNGGRGTRLSRPALGGVYLTLVSRHTRLR